MAVLCCGKRWTDKTPLLKFTCSSRIQMLFLSAGDDWIELNWVHTEMGIVCKDGTRCAFAVSSNKQKTLRSFALL